MALKKSVKDIVVKKLEEYEGRYNHFYLDTKSKVTVGVGHLVKNKQSVSSLTMYTIKNKKADKIATLKQKQTEYTTIAKQKKNYKAKWYKKHTTLIMKKVDINKQRTSHLNTFYKELVKAYTKKKGYTVDFDSFPDKVQIALFDMVFNLGSTRLRTKFKKFNTAIKSEKWDDAAKQCNRPDVNVARNTYVKGLFNDTHNAKKAKTKSSNAKKIKP